MIFIVFHFLHFPPPRYRRAIDECDSACTCDPNNGEGFLLRARCFETVKEFAKAIEDIDALSTPEMLSRNREAMSNFFGSDPMVAILDTVTEQLAAEAAPDVVEEGGAAVEEVITTAGAQELGISFEQEKEEKERNKKCLDEWKKKLQQKKAARDETFEDRLEDSAAAGLKELRERFEEVCARNGLKQNDEKAGELADLIQREGESISAERLAAIFQLDEDDADVMLAWIEKGIRIHQALNE